MEIVDPHFGRTALAYAIVKEETDKALELLEACDDVNQADRRGYAYLHFAAQMELPEVTAALLQKGAEPDVRTATGGTPLRMAVARSRAYPPERALAVVRLLLAYGADPGDAVNGVSVRELAGQTGLPELAALLAAGEED